MCYVSYLSVHPSISKQKEKKSGHAIVLFIVFNIGRYNLRLLLDVYLMFQNVLT